MRHRRHGTAAVLTVASVLLALVMPLSPITATAQTADVQEHHDYMQQRSGYAVVQMAPDPACPPWLQWLCRPRG